MSTRTLSNNCSLLSSGKSSSLAYTVYAADGTISQVRVYGSMAEIGTSAIYTGPAITVADTLAGYVLYDYDGDAETVGTVIPPENFAASRVTIDLAQALSSPRALDSVVDAELTLNDMAHCAIAVTAGKQAKTGTQYVVKTPSTGSVIRTFVLDNALLPSTRT